MCKLKYKEFVNYTSGTGSDVLFRLNSVYDPYYAAGGYTPHYMSELSALYSHYRVYAAKYSI